MTVARARPHSDAVVARLAAVAVPVGRGRPPTGFGWQGSPGTSNFKAYAVLYPFVGESGPSSLALTHSAFDFPFQLTCVGAVQEQAQELVDDVRTALIGVTPVVAGRTAFPIYPVALNQPVMRDDGVTPPVHYGITRFHFRSEPA